MAKQKQVEGQMSFADFLTLQPAEAAVSDYPRENQTGIKETDDADDALFEAEFAKLTALFDKVKAPDFDAMEILSPIANAVKTAIEEGIAFPEALERHCSKRSAERILAAFDEGKRAELMAIIGGMHDEI